MFPSRLCPGFCIWLCEQVFSWFLTSSLIQNCDCTWPVSPTVHVKSMSAKRPVERMVNCGGVAPAHPGLNLGTHTELQHLSSPWKCDKLLRISSMQRSCYSVKGTEMLRGLPESMAILGEGLISRCLTFSDSKIWEQRLQKKTPDKYQDMMRKTDE